MKPPFLTFTDALLTYQDPTYAGKGQLIVLQGKNGGEAKRWPEVIHAALATAAGLRARGLKSRDVVFIALPNSIDVVVAYCACVLAGCLPCIVPRPHEDNGEGTPVFPRHVMAATEVCQPALVISKRAGENAYIAGIELCCMARLAGHFPLSADEVAPARPEELLHIQLTSGSTSVPKAASISHANVVANIVLSAAATQVAASDYSGSIWLPLFHDMGLIALLSAIYVDGSIVIQQSEDFIHNPMGWLRNISRYRCNMSAVPTFALAYCVRRFNPLLLDGADLSSMTHLIVGAERVHYATLKSFADTFAQFGFNPDSIKPCYGGAEMTLAVTIPDGSRGNSIGRFVLCDDSAGTYFGEPVLSMGKALGETTIEIRGEDGTVLSDGKLGHIHVKSPCIMPGYYRNPVATAQAISDGFFATGDLGYLADGELFVMGRIKEMIILRGRNYFPHEFEECLVRHPLVELGRAAALGVDDVAGGSEQLVLVIEPEHCRDLPLLTTQLQDLLRKEFGFGAHALHFVVRGGLPRTTSRKIQRVECKRLYRSGRLPLISLRDHQPG